MIKKHKNAKTTSILNQLARYLALHKGAYPFLLVREEAQ